MKVFFVCVVIQVRIALQLEDGSRLQGNFSSGQTLWDLLTHFPQIRCAVNTCCSLLILMRLGHMSPLPEQNPVVILKCESSVGLFLISRHCCQVLSTCSPSFHTPLVSRGSSPGLQTPPFVSKDSALVHLVQLCFILAC